MNVFYVFSLEKLINIISHIYCIYKQNMIYFTQSAINFLADTLESLDQRAPKVYGRNGHSC